MKACPWFLVRMGSGLLASSLLVLIATSAAHAQQSSATSPPSEAKAPSPESPSTIPDEEQPPTIDVLEGLRSGQIAAEAEGRGDGRVTLHLTNRTGRKLRVVLPPGLVAAGATGQMGMMGGMGGGMGGMGGGMMGGMGGMGGGMMGGMGGMGGGMMGGRGGMMGGMGRGGGTMPASMGMMMLGRLIMSLIGEKDSWDMSSLMMGMMGGMGGMGMMGGMGGGMMGGMGGMGGMMGGGMRSVPPTSLPFTTIEPHKSRHLPTPTVSLSRPQNGASSVFAAKGEKLKVGDIAQITHDERTQATLKQLARDKAPQTVAQLVMWNVSAGLDWGTITRLSSRWANDHERALARQFVDQLDASSARSGAKAPAESGRFYWDLTSETEGAAALAGEMRNLLAKLTILGLQAREDVPDRPSGPALACRALIDDAKITVHFATTGPKGLKWVPVGSFTLKRPARDDSAATKEALTREAITMTDTMAAGILSRLVHVKLSKPKRVQNKLVYRVQVANDSPMILNGVAIAGPEDLADEKPTALAGFCVPPHKSLTLPATSDLVDRLQLKEGIRAVAADLSGL